MSADAYHLTASHPDGLGAKLVMRNALEDAEMTPEDIDYINVHGTSTPVGDISEVKAIKEVFGDHAYNLNISSTKSMTGHLLGAAGAIEAMFCIKAINDGIIPPTINHADGCLLYTSTARYRNGYPRHLSDSRFRQLFFQWRRDNLNRYGISLSG